MTLPYVMCEGVVQQQTDGTDGHPQETVGKADLTEKIQRQIPIVPDVMLAVDEKPGNQLHGGDGSCTGYGLEG